jgi:hypothetical protein
MKSLKLTVLAGRVIPLADLEVELELVSADFSPFDAKDWPHL